MALHKETILIVDDKPASFVVYDAILSHDSYVILKATSGFEALAVINDTKVSLILMNVQMPVMNGFETALEIRKNSTNKKIPILFITAFDRDQVMSQNHAMDCPAEFLFKPFSETELQLKVREVLDRSA